MSRIFWSLTLSLSAWACFEPPQGTTGEDELDGQGGTQLPTVNESTAEMGGTNAGAAMSNMSSNPTAGGGRVAPGASECRAAGESCNRSSQCCREGQCVNFECQVETSGVPEMPGSGDTEASAGQSSPTEQSGQIDDETLVTCADQMIGLFESVYARAECDQYDAEQERMAQSRNTLYWSEDVAASCMLFECAGCDALMSTSGFPTTRSCGDLDEQVTILRNALTVAREECDCEVPIFQVRVLSLADFVGGESCDEMICRLGVAESVTVSE